MEGYMFLTTLNGLNNRRVRPAYRLGSPSDIFDKFIANLEPLSVLAEDKNFSFSPHLEIEESEAAITVKAELPGMKLEDINVDLTAEALTISGEKTEQKKSGEEKGGYYYSERKSGSFQRIIPLNM